MSNSMGNDDYSLRIRAVLMRAEGKSYRAISKALGVSVNSIGVWYAKFQKYGEKGLYSCGSVKQKSSEEKREIILEIENKGLSLTEASQKYLLTCNTIRSWMTSYKKDGMQGLERKNKLKGMPKKKREYSPGELDELTELRRRNEWLEAENAMLKKAKALVEAKRAQQRANGQESSKN